jgi:hypothetical protein
MFGRDELSDIRARDVADKENFRRFFYVGNIFGQG